MFVNYAGVVRADCDIGDNRAYDPHAWGRNAEQAMATRAPQVGASWSRASTAAGGSEPDGKLD